MAQTKEKNSLKAELLSWLKLAVLVLAIGLPVRFFVFQPIRVEKTSMLPTLRDGQYMATYKLGYKMGEPKRGDIVVCHYPNEEYDFVKRIVGMPGETLEIIDGQVYIDGELLEESYVQPDNRSYETLEKCQLGNDEYFLMGDNRKWSTDSRELGPLQRKALVGHSLAVMWPPSDWHILN